jgi:hypothetical protein
MSRQLKRVPMDFKWPLEKIWGGFLNPYYKQSTACPDCKNGYDRAGGRPEANAALFHDQWYGNGDTTFDPFAYGAKSAPLTTDHPAYKLAVRNVDQAPDFYRANAETRARFEQFERVQREEGIHVIRSTFDRQSAIERESQRLFELWRYQWCHHLIQADVDALVAGGRLWDFTRVARTDEQREIVRKQLEEGGNSWLPGTNGYHPTADEVNAWSYEGLGHGGSNHSICVEARCKREGVPFMCASCNGTGRLWPSPEIKQRYDSWTEEDPPTGEGYQLWENCSEGSPVSPVFASLDDLCTWAADNATTFANFRATKAEWLEMLDGGIVHAKVGNAIFL